MAGVADRLRTRLTQEELSGVASASPGRTLGLITEEPLEVDRRVQELAELLSCRESARGERQL